MRAPYLRGVSASARRFQHSSKARPGARIVQVFMQEQQRAAQFLARNNRQFAANLASVKIRASYLPAIKLATASCTAIALGDDAPENVWLKVHFSPSAASQAAGHAFLARKWRRQVRSPEMTSEGIAAQRAAIGKHVGLRGTEGYLEYLREIRMPVLIVQGSNDVIIPTHNSYVMQQTLPDAQLVLYPDSNHGSFFQYPETFVAQAALFLDR